LTYSSISLVIVIPIPVQLVASAFQCGSSRACHLSTYPNMFLLVNYKEEEMITSCGLHTAALWPL